MNLIINDVLNVRSKIKSFAKEVVCTKASNRLLHARFDCTNGKFHDKPQCVWADACRHSHETLGVPPSLHLQLKDIAQ